jgi:FkbM family methyltransferase
MDLEFDDRTELYYRKNTSDLILRKTKDGKVKGYYEPEGYRHIFKVCKDKVVMDIGGNIGVFTNEAVRNSAKQVISYEPEPDNYEIFNKQKFMKSGKVLLINAAMSDKVGTIDFYQSKETDKCKGRHSILPIRGRNKITVNTVSWEEELKKYKPDILKIDIEGGEFFLDWNILPKSVEYIAIEIHRRGHEKEADDLLALIESKFTPYHKKTSVYFGKEDTHTFVGKLI